jgi:hypothetical protein
MYNQIKSIIIDKVREIGFSDDLSLIWQEEIIVAKETDWTCFPEWNCTYFSSTQTGGSICFYIRFSVDGTYLDYIPSDLNEVDITIHLHKDYTI